MKIKAWAFMQEYKGKNKFIFTLGDKNKSALIYMKKPQPRPNPFLIDSRYNWQPTKITIEINENKSKKLRDK